MSNWLATKTRGVTGRPQRPARIWNRFVPNCVRTALGSAPSRIVRRSLPPTLRVTTSGRNTAASATWCASTSALVTPPEVATLLSTVRGRWSMLPSA